MKVSSEREIFLRKQWKDKEIENRIKDKIRGWIQEILDLTNRNLEKNEDQRTNY